MFRVNILSKNFAQFGITEVADHSNEHFKQKSEYLIDVNRRKEISIRLCLSAIIRDRDLRRYKQETILLSPFQAHFRRLPKK